jgi:hypothetical protein
MLEEYPAKRTTGDNNMKNLDQRIETELDSNLYLCHDFNEIKKEFMRLTREWLKDTSEVLWLKANCPQSYHSNEPEKMKLCGKRELLKELVDDLKENITP